MRARIENWLLGHWYANQRPPWYLRVLELVYYLGFKCSQKTAGRKSRRYRPPLPLVVIGNLSAGGAGKTPLVMRLCQLAVDMGLRPGIATTGYGRTGKQTVLVGAGDDAALCGDEPVMMARRTGAQVVVARDRCEAVRKLADIGVDLVFSDDGLQAASLERDIELCVVDGERGLGNGHMIPAGPLREPPERLVTVDHVIANGEWPGKVKTTEVSTMHMDAYVVRSIDDTKMYPVEEFVHMCSAVPVHAISGIGNPDRFFNMLRELGFLAETHAFPDHHSYTIEDFAKVKPGTAIIMTEKDAVKCRSFGLENAWYIPVEVRLPEAFEERFSRQLAELMEIAR